MNRPLAIGFALGLVVTTAAPARALLPLLCTADEDCRPTCEDTARSSSTARETRFADVVACCGQAVATAECGLWGPTCACALRDGGVHYPAELVVSLEASYVSPEGSGELECLYADRRGHGCLLTPAEAPDACRAHADCQAACDLLAGRIEAADAAPLAWELAAVACLGSGSECGCLLRSTEGCLLDGALVDCDTDLRADEPPAGGEGEPPGDVTSGTGAGDGAGDGAGSGAGSGSQGRAGRDEPGSAGGCAAGGAGGGLPWALLSVVALLAAVVGARRLRRAGRG